MNSRLYLAGWKATKLSKSEIFLGYVVYCQGCSLDYSLNGAIEQIAE